MHLGQTDCAYVNRAWPFDHGSAFHTLPSQSAYKSCMRSKAASFL